MSYSNIKVVKKYAKVLFDLSCPQKLDLRHDEVYSFLCIFENFKKVLLSPIISLDKKREVLNLALDELKNNDDEFKNFIRVVLDNKRLDVLCDILTAYDELIKEYRSVVTFELTVSRELEQFEKDEIAKKLSEITKKEISIDWIVDASIIGGIIIKCNDKLLDASIRRGVEKVAEEICSM